VHAAGFEHLPGGAETFGELFIGAPARSEMGQLSWAQRIAFATNGTKKMLPEALSLGVPLVGIPIGGDQPYCATRIEELGLGRRISEDERDAPTIRDAVRAVAGDPRYRARARAYAEEMRALPPMSHAVQLLEQLAADCQPIPLHRRAAQYSAG
jgi:Erythromycin biosynthesis protein CIII-like, C-terminal domain